MLLHRFSSCHRTPPALPFGTHARVDATGGFGFRRAPPFDQPKSKEKFKCPQKTTPFNACSQDLKSLS